MINNQNPFHKTIVKNQRRQNVSMRRFLIWKEEHINNQIPITHDQFFSILYKF